MGTLYKIVENVTESVQAVSFILQKAAASAWSRVMLMAIVGIAIMGSYLIYLTFLVNDYRSRSDEYLVDYQLASKELSDQRALDYIQLCIDARQVKDINQDYYCDDALSFYRDAFIDFPGGKTAENIERSAYGAMKAEMANRLRSTALQRNNLKTPSIDAKLSFMLNWGIWLICALGAITMAGTVLMTYRIANSSELLNRGKRTVLMP